MANGMRWGAIRLGSRQASKTYRYGGANGDPTPDGRRHGNPSFPGDVPSVDHPKAILMIPVNPPVYPQDRAYCPVKLKVNTEIVGSGSEIACPFTVRVALWLPSFTATEEEPETDRVCPAWYTWPYGLAVVPFCHTSTQQGAVKARLSVTGR